MLSSKSTKYAAICNINYLIANIDAKINEQLSIIITNNCFHELEASWQNLLFLIRNKSHSKKIKIKLFNISKKELQQDLFKAIDFEQTVLFENIYNKEYGIAGGEPFGLLIGDYEFCNELIDIETLNVMTQIAASAFAPFISNISPEFFGFNSFKELGKHIDLEKMLNQMEYFHWHKLRNSDDSRFLGLTLPKRLLRIPHKKHELKAYQFNYDSSWYTNNYLWGNACFGFAVCVMRAFSDYGWFANIRGISYGNMAGVVPNSAIDYAKIDGMNLIPKSVTDVIISDSQEKIFSDYGFIPLCQQYGGEHAVFYSNSSVQKTKQYQSVIANYNAFASSMLQYILCACRFAHYIKLIGREKVGSFLSPQELQHILNQWLLNYVANNSTLPLIHRAKYPLQQANAQVNAVPSKPGYFYCIIHLKPYFQLETVATNIVLITEIKR